MPAMTPKFVTVPAAPEMPTLVIDALSALVTVPPSGRSIPSFPLIVPKFATVPPRSNIDADVAGDSAEVGHCAGGRADPDAEGVLKSLLPGDRRALRPGPAIDDGAAGLEINPVGVVLVSGSGAPSSG